MLELNTNNIQPGTFRDKTTDYRVSITVGEREVWTDYWEDRQHS